VRAKCVGKTVASGPLLASLEFASRISKCKSFISFQKLYCCMLLLINILETMLGEIYKKELRRIPLAGSIPGGGWEFFSSPSPERLWGPPSLLSNGYQGLFPRGKVAGA
jgi:hypothetical protein